MLVCPAVGVPHVIAVAANTQLADVAARVFTRHFYLALAVGKTVKESFDIGTNTSVFASLCESRSDLLCICACV